MACALPALSYVSTGVSLVALQTGGQLCIMPLFTHADLLLWFVVGVRKFWSTIREIEASLSRSLSHTHAHLLALIVVFRF